MVTPTSTHNVDKHHPKTRDDSHFNIHFPFPRKATTGVVFEHIHIFDFMNSKTTNLSRLLKHKYSNAQSTKFSKLTVAVICISQDPQTTLVWKHIHRSRAYKTKTSESTAHCMNKLISCRCVFFNSGETIFFLRARIQQNVGMLKDICSANEAKCMVLSNTFTKVPYVVFT